MRSATSNVIVASWSDGSVKDFAPRRCNVADPTKPSTGSWGLLRILRLYPVVAEIILREPIANRVRLFQR
jgi:hypothetical protein